MRFTKQLSVAAALVVGIVIGAYVFSPAASEGPVGQAGPSDEDIVLTAALEPFEECDELLAYFQEHALERVGPYGLGGPAVFDAMAAEENAGGAEGGDAASAGTASDGGARADSAPAPTGDGVSGTNNQEAGVDEADIVKTDGEILVTVVSGRLQVIDLSNPEEVLATVRLAGWDHQLFLDGDRLLVMAGADSSVVSGTSDAARSLPPDGGYTAVSTLTLVDLSDPEDPDVTASLTLDGSYRSARMVDGVARVVLSSQPAGLPFSYPEGGGLRAERAATERNREVIRESTIENWLPYYVLEDRRGSDSVTTEGLALSCDAVSRPPEFAGFGLASVLSVDLAADLVPTDGTAVVAAGETVYASAQNLYITTNQWFDPAAIEQNPNQFDEDYSTEIHAFDITQPQARYVASGSVRGHVLNQFSLSEHQGYLRVATTDGTPWSADDSTESFVTVLQPTDGVLERVGQVGDLGRGERIYAVRFLGEVGYVVTFRETDPLYTIDLSDPTQPTTTGELKIMGYSAYLHPIDDGLVLGVGQDATRQGRTKGTQVSLFDVSDPAAPQRVSQLTMPDSSSEVEWDHRAFLYWAPEHLAVIPFTTYDMDPSGEGKPEIGARALRVRTADIRELGVVTHAEEVPDPWLGQIRRSIVAGDRLFTLSEQGLLVSDLSTFEPQSFTRFN